jgi:hypothetical protein
VARVDNQPIEQKENTMPTDTVRIEDFITRNGITITSVYADRNPAMEGSANMDNYKVTLKRSAAVPRVGVSGIDLLTHKRIVARLTVTFSKGMGHHGAEPTADEVLDCLASDAAGIENAQSFEDWCSEYGYDTDSRKAEKTFKACEHSARRLKAFLGDDLYDQLLWHTERQ